MKCIFKCLVIKWKQPYYKTCGFLKSREAITLFRATHRCIQGSWVTAFKISESETTMGGRRGSPPILVSNTIKVKLAKYPCYLFKVAIRKCVNFQSSFCKIKLGRESPHPWTESTSLNLNAINDISGTIRCSLDFCRANRYI